MSKIAIQFKLLDILKDGIIHSSKELEEKLEVKNSTLRRYIDDLIIVGFQIESIKRKGGGYRLDKKMCTNNILKMIDE